MVKIKLLSVGGGGQNILTEIYKAGIKAGIKNVEFLVLNSYKESQHHVNFAPFILLVKKSLIGKEQKGSGIWDEDIFYPLKRR